MHDAWCKNKEESNGTVVNVTTAPSFKEKESNTEELTYALPKLSKAFSESVGNMLKNTKNIMRKKEVQQKENRIQIVSTGQCLVNVIKM